MSADHPFRRIDVQLFIIVNNEPERRLQVEPHVGITTKSNLSQKQNSDNSKIRLIMIHNHADA